MLRTYRVYFIAVLGLILTGCKVEFDADLTHSNLVNRDTITVELQIEVTSCQSYEDSRKPSNDLISAVEGIARIFPKSTYQECYKQRGDSHAYFRLPVSIETQAERQNEIHFLQNNNSLFLVYPNTVRYRVEQFKRSQWLSENQGKISLNIRYDNDTDRPKFITVGAVYINGSPFVGGIMAVPAGVTVQITPSDVAAEVFNNDGIIHLFDLDGLVEDQNYKLQQRSTQPRWGAHQSNHTSTQSHEPIVSQSLPSPDKNGASVETSSQYDFDGDGIADRLTHDYPSGKTLLWLSSNNREYVYPIEQFKLRKGIVAKTLIRELSQSEEEIYLWKSSLQNWQLQYRVKYKNNDRSPLMMESVKMTHTEKTLGEDTTSSIWMVSETQKRQTNTRLNAIEKLLDKKQITEAIEGLNIYDAVLFKQQLNSRNVLLLNNLAYYLEQNSHYYESAIILEAIVELFPDRVAARINLGDAYWHLNIDYYRQKAKVHYQRYVEMMQRNGREKRIPDRIWIRLKQI